MCIRDRRESTSSVEAWGLAQRGERERKLAETLLQEGDHEGAQRSFSRADSFLALAEAADRAWSEPPTLRSWVAYRMSRTATDFEALLSRIQEGLGHAQRALDLDPNQASALEARGTLRYWLWLQGVTADTREAESLLQSARSDLEAAVDVDPSRAGAHSTLSHLYYQVSDLTDALVSAKAAYDADAFLASAPDVLWRLFSASYDTEQFTQARYACDEGFSRFPRDHRFSECRIIELTLPTSAPDPDEAWRLHDAAVELAPEARKGYEHHFTLILVAEVLARAELPDSARHVLMAARAGADVDPTLELPFYEAHVRAVLGDFDEAVACLNAFSSGFSSGGGGDAGDWASHWWWRDIQAHAGFQALVRRTR
jgi:serine/threonine-protein kinase